MPTSPKLKKRPNAPTYDDVVSAAKQISGHAVRTPLLESPLFNEKLGGRLLIKAECLQRSGAFKFRGAYNRLSRLDDAQRKSGVVAFSSGNHAQGVALVSQMLGVPAVIVMPKDAPEIKVSNTRAYGAEVIFYDRDTDDREKIGASLASDRGATLVPSFDDPFIIAGQGTAGLELADQAKELGAKLDSVIIPCVGGGLTSGCALALRKVTPDTEIYAAEPETFDDTARSLAADERVSVKPDQKTICDALMMPTPGEITFSINRKLLTGALTATDDDVLRAMKAAFNYFKLAVEPGGAIALAVAMSGAFDIRGKTVGVICSGGNVDAQVFAAALNVE